MSPYDDLIADPFSIRRYLAILEPYDPSRETTIPLYLSDHGFTTEPNEVPGNQYFDARLLSALSFERHLYRSGRLEGRSLPGFGTLDINNADGALDDGAAWHSTVAGSGFCSAAIGSALRIIECIRRYGGAYRV